jgi:hypothetical protein
MFGGSDLLTGDAAIAMDIETALQVQLGECFWSTTFGVDWIGLMGTPGWLEVEQTLIVQARAIIVGCQGVVAILSVDASVDSMRHLTITYQVTTENGGKISQSAVVNPS